MVSIEFLCKEISFFQLILIKTKTTKGIECHKLLMGHEKHNIR